MLQKLLFTKYIMQRIGFHCTVLEKLEITQKERGIREKRREQEDGGKSTGDITDNKSGCTYLPGNLILLFFF